MKQKNRIYSIDIVRGLIMVIMALDHVRNFFHDDALLHNPLDLQTTTPFLFFTRWITHFCAPVFVFLAGISAYLAGLNRSKKSLSYFLMKRGVWLILVEIFIITLGTTFNPFYNVIVLQVIWAIGISMFLLGFLIWLRIPYLALFVTGILIVAGHNLLDNAESIRHHEVGFAWDLIHAGHLKMYEIFKGHSILISYAFLPWTGIMILGFCIGKLYDPQYNAAKRKRALFTTGFALVALFVLLRLINSYGDPMKWIPQKSSLYTFLSFMNVTKYPPSLMYTSITIGPALILLALIENTRNRFSLSIRVFGQVPFFYYVLHFYFIHFLTTIAFFFCGYGADDIVTTGSRYFFRPPQFGFPLWAVYIIWIGLILSLYPLCRWYKNYKASHFQWWLSYL